MNRCFWMVFFKETRSFPLNELGCELFSVLFWEFPDQPWFYFDDRERSRWRNASYSLLRVHSIDLNRREFEWKITGKFVILLVLNILSKCSRIRKMSFRFFFRFWRNNNDSTNAIANTPQLTKSSCRSIRRKRIFFWSIE